MSRKKTWRNIPFELSRELIVKYVPNPSLDDYVYDGGLEVFDEQTSQALNLGKKAEESIFKLLGGNCIEEPPNKKWLEVPEDIPSIELVIDGNSSGYVDPGCIRGPVENCYPPEEDDCRELDSMQVIFHKSITCLAFGGSLVYREDVCIPVEDENAGILWDQLLEQVYEFEIDTEGE